MVDNYSVLGISRNSTKEDIKKAYRKLSLVYHPDRPSGNKDMFIRIKSAYEELMVIDPTRVHHQYEHRNPPYTAIFYTKFNSKGDLVISLLFRNINSAETLGVLYKEYHWSLFGLNGGEIEIKKKDLIRCGYKFRIKFTPQSGFNSLIKEFKFNDPRGKVEKFVYKVKQFF